MFGSRIDRRKLAVLGAVVLIAGCNILPKGKPKRPPAPAPADTLPKDQARHRVALLVPLSGPNAALGQSIANATTMALLDTQAKTIRITTYDTAADAGAAARQAMADGNRLVLGPLTAEEVGPVVAMTRAARVPLLTYSGDAGVAARDVFVLGTTPDDAVQRVVKHAYGRGARRFALLAPKGDYGSRASSAYGAAVRAAGGTLAGSESYDRSNTSVVSAAQRLRTRGGFDAVLIADSPRFAALAAPRLKKAGAASPRILGTELWSGELSVTKTPALRGAWFASVADTRFAQFAASYKARFGAAPYRQATYGYDSVLLTVRIARDWRAGTAFPSARLADRDGFLGLDGPFRFADSGLGERALEVREVRAGGMTIVSPAPAKFAP
jgi:branched-chain amino acid transport system substrate-binding protein